LQKIRNKKKSPIVTEAAVIHSDLTSPEHSV